MIHLPPAKQPVLADGLFPHYTRPASPQTYETNVRLPNLTLRKVHATGDPVHGRRTPTIAGRLLAITTARELQITADPEKPLRRGLARSGDGAVAVRRPHPGAAWARNSWPGLNARRPEQLRNASRMRLPRFRNVIAVAIAAVAVDAMLLLVAQDQVTLKLAAPSAPPSRSCRLRGRAARR